MKLLLPFAALMLIGATGPQVPFRFTSVSVQLPDDPGQFTGTGADALNANCTGCHSTSMITTQPKLSSAQWSDEVKKMRETYKAPIAETDVPAILAGLDAISAKQPAK